MSEETPPAIPKYIGARVQRVEDPRLLRGRGRFLDDIELPGTLHAAFVRSPFAHAAIRRIDAGAAKTHPGVAAVFTGADLAESTEAVTASVARPEVKAATRRALAVEKARRLNLVQRVSGAVAGSQIKERIDAVPVACRGQVHVVATIILSCQLHHSGFMGRPQTL